MQAALTILAVFLIFGVAAVIALRVGGAQEKRTRLMSVIASGRTGNEAVKEKALARQKADIARKLKEASQEQEKRKKDKTTIRELMMQAGIEAPLSRYFIFSALAALAVWTFFSIVTGWPLFARLCLTVVGFFGLPKLFLKMKAAKRQKQFLEDFPDALDASVRLLQAGMPISEAVSMVSREYTGPLKEEMLRIYDNQKLGVPLGQAALETARRIPLTEVHMFATALQIQSETGSSLSEVLGNLSNVIRARFRLKRKVKALSSEAKASAAIIACLPILVSVGLYFANEKYISILFDTKAGNAWLCIAGGWMLCGVLIMRQMINFKV